MGWWVVVVHLDYNVSSGPFLCYEIEIEIGDGPGPKLDTRFLTPPKWHSASCSLTSTLPPIHILCILSKI